MSTYHQHPVAPQPHNGHVWGGGRLGTVPAAAPSPLGTQAGPAGPTAAYGHTHSVMYGYSTHAPPSVAWSVHGVPSTGPVRAGNSGSILPPPTSQPAHRQHAAWGHPGAGTFQHSTTAASMGFPARATRADSHSSAATAQSASTTVNVTASQAGARRSSRVRTAAGAPDGSQGTYPLHALHGGATVGLYGVQLGEVVTPHLVEVARGLKITGRSRLPLLAVQLLRAWLILHDKFPYPDAATKRALGEACGLKTEQVTTWFANQRKRHWFPKKRQALLRRGGDVTAQASPPPAPTQPGAGEPAISEERDRSNRRLNVDRRRFGTRIKRFHSQGSFSSTDVHGESDAAAGLVHHAKVQRLAPLVSPQGTSAAPAPPGRSSSIPSNPGSPRHARVIAVGAFAAVWVGLTAEPAWPAAQSPPGHKGGDTDVIEALMALPTRVVPSPVQLPASEGGTPLAVSAPPSSLPHPLALAGGSAAGEE